VHAMHRRGGEGGCPGDCGLKAGLVLRVVWVVDKG